MKTYIRITYISILFASTLVANAQPQINNRHFDQFWPAKGIAKFTNKYSINTSHYTIKSIGSYDGIISKKVLSARPEFKKRSSENNVISKGSTEWIVSKQVNKLRK